MHNVHPIWVSLALYDRVACHVTDGGTLSWCVGVTILSSLYPDLALGYQLAWPHAVCEAASLAMRNNHRWAQSWSDWCNIIYTCRSTCARTSSTASLSLMAMGLTRAGTGKAKSMFRVHLVRAFQPSGWRWPSRTSRMILQRSMEPGMMSPVTLRTPLRHHIRMVTPRTRQLRWSRSRH